MAAPLFHGAVGILDELTLIACIAITAATLVIFYVWQLRKTKVDK